MENYLIILRLFKIIFAIVFLVQIIRDTKKLKEITKDAVNTTDSSEFMACFMRRLDIKLDLVKYYVLVTLVLL